MQTVKVKELKKLLESLPEDYDVYIGSEEDETFMTTSMKFGTEVYKEDRILIIYAKKQVDFANIAPTYVLKNK